jgi:hypothetical protein
MALRSLHNWDAGRAGFPADPTLLANGARANPQSMWMCSSWRPPQPEDDPPHGYVPSTADILGQKLLHHHMSSRLVESGTAPLKPDLSDKPRAWFWPPALRFCNRVATLFSRGRRQAALPQTPSCRRTRRRSVSAWWPPATPMSCAKPRAWRTTPANASAEVGLSNRIHIRGRRDQRRSVDKESY